MHRSRLLLALLFGAIAFAQVFAITRSPGPGLDPDAMAYLNAANSLVHQGRLLDVRDDWVSADSTTPLTRWPPGYSIAIAVPVALGVSAVQSARTVMALSAFVTLAVLTWVVCGAAGPAAAALLGLLLVVTPAVGIMHASVLSEPLFVATLVAMFALMLRERPRPIAEGVAAAIASLVRYAGLAAMGVVVLWELARAGSWRERLRRAALAAVPGVFANGWWWWRAARIGGRTAVRDFSVYGQIGYTLREGAETVAGWVGPRVPPPWSGWGAIGVLVALGMTAGLGARRSALGDYRRVIGAAGLVTVCYLGLVLAARVLADPNIPLDERLLGPAMGFVTVIVVLVIAAWWSGASRGGRVAAAIALLAWTVGSASVMVEQVRYGLEVGNDYADICWRGSPVIAWTREHGAGHPLVSNAPPALFFHTGRLVREMPLELRADSMVAFRDTLAARRAYVVLFDQSCASSIDQPDSLVRALGLVREAALPSGSAWRAPEPPR